MFLFLLKSTYALVAASVPLLLMILQCIFTSFTNFSISLHEKFGPRLVLIHAIFITAAEKQYFTPMSDESKNKILIVTIHFFFIIK